jgi:hypothetical protein
LWNWVWICRSQAGLQLCFLFINHLDLQGLKLVKS